MELKKKNNQKNPSKLCLSVIDNADGAAVSCDVKININEFTKWEYKTNV